VLSKRRLLKLVNEKFVAGWTDPRMPTLAGMRRRGYTPEAIRHFCERIGVGKRESLVDMALLEYCVREDLNKKAPRVMGVLRPLKVIIDNYPEGKEEFLDAVNNPEDPAAGSRQIPFSHELYIEQEDFMEDPPKQFFRLAPGREVRLRYAYFIKCVSVVKDPASGKATELHCTYDPATRGGDAPDGRKVKATLHWVSARHAVPIEVRLYDKFFNKPNPNDVEEGKEFTEYINPDSLIVLKSCMVEPSLAEAKPGESCQFERMGYFCADTVDSKPGKPVFNRIVTLKDDWVKIQKSGK
jgi:glutaminyl-tRNA synthetase